jgi:Trk K+ transport system NAD-binding subunit
MPEPDYELAAGDILVLLGRPEKLALAEQKLVQG